jgi:hypothetical protein
VLYIGICPITSGELPRSSPAFTSDDPLLSTNLA